MSKSSEGRGGLLEEDARDDVDVTEDLIVGDDAVEMVEMNKWTPEMPMSM